MYKPDDEEYVTTEDWSISGEGDVDWDEVEYVEEILRSANA